MFVQWCVKGVRGDTSGVSSSSGIDDAMALEMLRDGGIRCNWWRAVRKISPQGMRRKLTRRNLDRHVHDYHNFGADTPFISLTAGCVERDAALRLNRIHTAQEVALRFATSWGQHTGYLFYCWVIVGLKPAVEVEAVAEEVRELNTYVSYSDFQLEGEITAKINVPSNQIERCERWDPPGSIKTGKFVRSQVFQNQAFTPPETVSNIRNLL